MFSCWVGKMEAVIHNTHFKLQFPWRVSLAYIFLLQSKFQYCCCQTSLNGSDSLSKHFQAHAYMNHFHWFRPQYSSSNLLYFFINNLQPIIFYCLASEPSLRQSWERILVLQPLRNISEHQTSSCRSVLVSFSIFNHFQPTLTVKRFQQYVAL